VAIGSAWDRLGETDRAVRAFDEARRAGLAGPGADLGAALALARAGRRAEARRVLDDVARRFPDNPAVRELRTRLQ
jgi:TolA-binding protein